MALTGTFTDRDFALLQANQALTDLLPIAEMKGIPVQRYEVDLWIANATELVIKDGAIPSIDGLQWIEGIPGNFVISNLQVESKTAVMDKLDTVGGYILIEYSSLNRFALPNMRIINSLALDYGNLTIRENPGLTHLLLPSLVESGTVNVFSNASLSVVDLKGLIRIKGYLSIYGNPKLDSFDISGIEFIDFGLYIKENGVRTSVVFSNKAPILAFLPGGPPLV